MKYVIFGFFIFLFSNLCSQTFLSGKVIDEKNNPVIDANILLVNYSTKKIVAIAITNDHGIFKLVEKLEIGIYTVEITRLGFSKFMQSVIIDKDRESNIDLEFILERSDLFTLNDVVIKSEPPIIVKKDTIIYNVEKHTQAYDQNLEQVLSRLQGFEIEPNGDIKVNGKLINKVLIDGKEVSDLGNSILIKTLSPEHVAKIEVRFNEKNEKLKDNLLSDEKFAVLDIQLKPDLNKVFFGKLQASIGYQNSTKAGAYSNFFSLNEFFNLQLFGENTNFGNNFIDLKQT